MNTVIDINGLTLSWEEVEAAFASDDVELQAYLHLLLAHDLYTFRPRPDSPAEWDEQESFVESHANFSICLGGNGSGKTEAAAYKTAKYLTSRRPMRPGLPFWVVGESHELVGNVCWVEKLSRYIPQQYIKHIAWRNAKRRWPQAVVLWHPDGSERDGWVIEFKSFEEGVDNFQARSIGGYWLNETPPLSIVTEIQMRCREYDSPGWADFTPLSATAIEWEEKYHDPPPGWKFFHLNSLKNDRIAAGFMARTLASLPEDIRATRQFGFFGSMKGQVFKEWRPSVHIIDPFPVPEDWAHYRGLDFGYNNPFCCLWAARDPDGRYYFYDEHYESQQLHDHHAAKIHERFWKSGNPYYRDTFSDHDPQERAELAVRGIPTRLANKAIFRGIEAMRTCMMIQGDGRPRFHVFRNCKNLIREIPRYKWPDVKGKLGNEKNAAEAPVDFDNHAIDAARYIIATLEIQNQDNAPKYYQTSREQTNMAMPTARKAVPLLSHSKWASDSPRPAGTSSHVNRVKKLAYKGGKYGNFPE